MRGERIRLIEALKKLAGEAKVKSWFELIELIVQMYHEKKGPLYASEILRRRGYRGRKGSFYKVLDRLAEAGFIAMRREGRERIVAPTQLAYKLVEDP